MGIKHNGYHFTYHPVVLNVDIPLLDKTIITRIRNSIEKKLGSNPLLYGLPLRGSLKGYWKLRVGDYRIVYKIIKNEVRIFIIRHRSNVYETITKRTE